MVAKIMEYMWYFSKAEKCKNWNKTINSKFRNVLSNNGIF